MPSERLEATIAEVTAIWREVLGDDSIGPQSDLLQAASSSLQFVQVRSRLRTRLKRSVELIDLVDHPTPRQHAELVEAAPEWIAD